MRCKRKIRQLSDSWIDRKQDFALESPQSGSVSVSAPQGSGDPTSEGTRVRDRSTPIFVLLLACAGAAACLLLYHQLLVMLTSKLA